MLERFRGMLQRYYCICFNHFGSQVETTKRLIEAKKCGFTSVNRLVLVWLVEYLVWRNMNNTALKLDWLAMRDSLKQVVPIFSAWPWVFGRDWSWNCQQTVPYSSILLHLILTDLGV